MATAPQIQLRDSTGYTQNLVLTTTQDRIKLVGTLGSDTVDLQVSLNNGPFISDTTLVFFDTTSFAFPNPQSYPNGYALARGLNTIVFRAIDIVGGVSATSSAQITRTSVVQDIVAESPTGIRVYRRKDSVDILAAVPEIALGRGGVSNETTTSFQGFNYYASVTPGGPYVRLNSAPVLSPSIYEETLLGSSTENTTWATPEPASTEVHLLVEERDVFSNPVVTRLDQTYALDQIVGKLRFTSSFDSYNLNQFVSYRHTRTEGLNADTFVGVPDTDPLYYVVTGVFYDTAQSAEVETPYSQEVLGKPLIIDTNIRGLPKRTQTQIITSFAAEVQRVDQAMSIVPGSITRETSIDPFASEVERLWFLLDFVHQSQSFLTLMQLDDANGDGVSDPVATSAYKQALKAALGLSDDASVQRIIDTEFDRLAANSSKTRQGGRTAIGEAVLFRTTKPSVDQVIPAGSIVATESDTATNAPSVRYRIGGTYTMLASRAASYYNFDTRRYEITVDIVAEIVGESGNKPAGALKTLQGISGFQVTNTEAIVFGRDQESNADLAERCLLAYSSVDTGTEGGYLATTAAQIGVLKSKIVKSGDPLMMRDWDPVRKKHIGGKVDAWIQGSKERQVSDKFAFAFEIAKDNQCQIVDLPNLIFRVLDSRVTPNTPILEMLDNPTMGLGVRNVTKGLDYNLIGVTLLDYQTFQINTSLAQPTTDIDDIITADYRFRSANKFVFPVQPVIRVVSVVGEVSGSLNPEGGYVLYKTDDPLLEGESTIAQNYLLVNQLNGLPSGASILVNDERHVLLGSIEEPLLSIGINTSTIRVFSADRTVEYNGPSDPSPDFDIILGTDTAPAKIVRTSATTITNGQEVSVDYTHDENLTVTYVTNDLLRQVQQVLDIQRHITADVLAKQAIENPLDIENTIQLQKGATKDNVDPNVLTAVSVELDKKLIGEGIAQSDVIRTVDSVTGVDYSPVPYAKMAYADGARRIRESVLSTATRLPSLDIGGNRAFILTNPLKNPTTDGGGLVTEHKGVFQDDEAMALATSLELVCTAENQAFILGNTGAVIAGYTDTATLVSQGFLTPETQAEALYNRTANHVVLSLSGAGFPQDVPTNHNYTVSYIVRGAKGAQDIFAQAVEFISLGDLTITYRTA